MATIRIHDEKNTIIEHQEEVARFLDEQEVIYEQWNIEKLPSELSEKYDLTEDEKNGFSRRLTRRFRTFQPGADISLRMSLLYQIPRRILMNY